jgi:tetratricopeptide (TPR) repeat protein
MSMPGRAGDTLLDSALYCLGAQDYARAEKLISRILIECPSNIDALYFRVAVEQSRILDYESYTIDQKSFAVLTDSVEDQLERQLCILRGKDSLRCLFYLGNISGGESLIMAKCGYWFGAVKQAMLSINSLDRVVKCDSLMYEAYLGIGIFKYYLSVNFRWMPLIGNQIQEGIENIRMATQARFPYDLAAKNSYCWVVMDKGHYSTADSIAASVLAKMPDNTIFLRIRAYALYCMGRYREALMISRRLVDASKERKPVNWSDMMTGFRSVIACLDALGDRQQVLALSHEALLVSIPPPYDKLPYVTESRIAICQLQKKHRK